MEQAFNIGDKVINIVNNNLCVVTGTRQEFGVVKYRLGMGSNWHTAAELRRPDNEEPKLIVVEGWVAIDEAYAGDPYLHTEKPHAELREFCDTGDYETIWESDGEQHVLPFELVRRLFPDMTSESEPKKVRLTLEPIEE